MVPYYQGERLLGFGKEIPIGDELPMTKVEIFDTNIAIAKVPKGREGRGVYVGHAKLILNGPDRYWTWLGTPRFVSKGEITLHQESVSTNKRHPQVVWKKK